MRTARIGFLLGFLLLTAAGCFNTKPTRGRPRQLDPDQEISAPRVPVKDSINK